MRRAGLPVRRVFWRSGAKKGTTGLTARKISCILLNQGEGIGIYAPFALTQKTKAFFEINGNT